MRVRACAVIPSFNHWQALPAIIERLRALGLPVFVVDDGSFEPARSALAALAAPERGVHVARLERNRGKGEAVLAGFALARADGFSHAIQVDADGQHDLAAVADMLKLAEQRPDAIVAGQATYDASAPLGRRAGRWITHACVWVETLSFDIADSMCGLRVYPLDAVAVLEAPVGRRMDFDTDIIVRLHRSGVPVINHTVRVTYPAENLSNFDVWRDNLRISWMHTRLLLGTPIALPAILRNRRRQTPHATHWANLAERGLYWGLQICALAYRLLGRRVCMAILSVVVFYFYLTAGERRRASLVFLRRAFAACGRPPPGWWDGYRHFLSFAGRALDNFAAWLGRIPAGAVVARETVALEAAKADQRGAVFVVSHHGNVDISRALLDPATRRRVVVLVHTRHAENYNRILREFNAEAAVNMYQVTEMGADTAIELQQRVDRGEWLFIAGDRTPVGGGRRTSAAPFLGAAAEFSQGPYLLAALLDCPVYLFFCRREGGQYGLRVEKLADRIVLPRGKRTEALAAYAAAYAARLEKHVLEDPFQWYNFYDFWRPADSAERS